MTSIENILIDVANRLEIFNYPLYSSLSEFNELADKIPNENKYVLNILFPIQTVVKLGKMDSRMVTEEYTIKLRFLKHHKYHGEYVNEISDIMRTLRAIRSVYLVALKNREELKENAPQYSDNLLTSYETGLIHETDSELFGIETTIKITLVIPLELCSELLQCLDNSQIC